MDDILEALRADRGIWSDYLALCDCGGRRAGTPSEAEALKLVRQRMEAIGGRLDVGRVPYAGWRVERASLTLPDGTALACNPLLGSLSTDGVTAEVCDLGRGTLEDFERHAGEIPGRFVLVRHEYPFSTEHIHRRRKLGWAMERGAAGYIIANPNPGTGAVAGSSGRGGGPGIPAVGTDYESAARLTAAARSHTPVSLAVAGVDYAAETEALVLDLPGRGPQRVVLSAHVDGHDLAESAMDNATGVAVALGIARALAQRVAGCERGLRVAIFSAEEWALAGSKQYLDAMPAAERARMVLNVNLDTVGGGEGLTALTSEFPKLDAYVRALSAEHGLNLATYTPMMANSDHYNFARHGIPALRLVAGFNRPDSAIRYILTRGDTRERVTPGELAEAARVAATLVYRGLTAGDEEIAALRVM